MLDHVGRSSSMNKSSGAWTAMGANGVRTRGLTTSKAGLWCVWDVVLTVVLSNKRKVEVVLF